MGVTCFSILIFSSLLVFASAPDPVDGGWSQWTAYSKCSVTCGGGTQHRERTCNEPAPANQGKNCVGLDHESNNCNADPCTTKLSLTTTPIPDGQPGGFCTYNKTYDMCDGNYTCIGETCQCPDELFYEVKSGTKACHERLKAGDKCVFANQNCVKNSTCPESSPFICSCLHDYYKTSKNYCLLQKEVGDKCTTVEECRDGATCLDKLCHCDLESHYMNNGRCKTRVKVNDVCRIGIQHECIKDASCVDNRCQCNKGHYLKLEICESTILYNGTCDPDDTRTNVSQCESNSVCAGTPAKCQCNNPDDFFNGEKCEKRVLASYACPFIPGIQSRVETDNQCVENAHCDKTTRICKCDENDFFMRAGYCVHRIEEKEMCDSWSGYHNQCKDDLECLYGMCLPKDTFVG